MRLNCLVFAAALWVRSRLRGGLGVKRSVGLHGLVPHFFHVTERGRYLIVEDYIPRRRKERWVDRGDSFVLFDGLNRVRVYKLDAQATSDTLFGARRDALRRRDPTISS